MRKALTKIGLVFMSIIMLCILFPTVSLAHDVVDTSQKASLGINYVIEGVPFQLYQIGKVNGDGSFEINELYAKYGVSIDAENIEKSAAALSAYIKKDKIQPNSETVSDDNGYAVFNDLDTGVYLVLSNRIKKDNIYYNPSAVVVTLPFISESQYVYNSIVDMKFEMEEEIDLPIDIKVIKVWEDANDDKRPNGIKVILLRDGEVYDTVELNQNNSWQYTWENLSNEYSWDIIEEKVPENYNVTVEREGNTVILTNKKDDKQDDSSKPSNPDNSEKAPNTGQLYWPIPILAFSGLFLVVIGLFQRKKEEANEA